MIVCVYSHLLRLSIVYRCVFLRMGCCMCRHVSVCTQLTMLLPLSSLLPCVVLHFCFLAGAQLGCVMEEHEINEVSVIRVHQLLPHVHAGIAVGDIIASINGQSVRVVLFLRRTTRSQSRIRVMLAFAPDALHCVLCRACRIVVMPCAVLLGRWLVKTCSALARR